MEAKEESKEGLLDDGSLLTWGKSLAVFPCCMRESESAVFCVRLEMKEKLSLNWTQETCQNT